MLPDPKAVDKYKALTCVMPGCCEDLYLEWTLSQALCLGDLEPDEDPPWVDQTSTCAWKVVCVVGHVLLMPGKTGCPHCGDTDESCPHWDFDIEDQFRTFRRHDMTRLRRMLIAFATNNKLVAAEGGAA